MSLLKAETPFKFWMRVDESRQVCSIRFEMAQGRGVLSLRTPGREEPTPVSYYEELDIPADELRIGRFLHVLPSGNRRGFGLSGLTEELLQRVEADRWVQLDPSTEHGFRNLVMPAAAAPPAAPAAVSIGGDEVSAAPMGSRPPRQVPVAPKLAHEALSRLSHKDAIGYLQQEMAKVEALHQHLHELERRLVASEAREKDLLTVLQRWQKHR